RGEAARGGGDEGCGGEFGAVAWPTRGGEWLTQPLRQPLTDQTCNDVSPAARGKSMDDAHWPRRIGLRPRHARDRRQRGCARGQTQKSTAREFHSASLPPQPLADAE